MQMSIALLCSILRINEKKMFEATLNIIGEKKCLVTEIPGFVNIFSP